MIYKNKDVETRIWPTLQDAMGETLELEPGEEINLDLPAEFEDPYLKPVQGSQLPLSGDDKITAALQGGS